MNVITYEVAFYFNMFGALMKDLVHGNMHGNLFVTIKCDRLSVRLILESRKSTIN